MPSLRHLLAVHPTLLLIDTASSRIQAGLWTRDTLAKPAWQARDGEAGTELFTCVEALLVEKNLRLADIAAFVFCEGPGSVLGIRTAAVALRVWRALSSAPIPVYAFKSLDLVAQALARPGTKIIADARRDAWHVAQLGQVLKRVPTAELGSGELVMPEGFRHWSTPPAGVARTGYDLATLLPALETAELFQPCAEPDAFLHEDPTYVTWTPQVHQAPVSN